MTDNKVKLTKRFVDSLAPDKEKRIFYWDTEVVGFGVRVYPTGRKAYYFQYRNHFNETRKIKLGGHGNITTEMAREKAVHLSLEVHAGQDPSAAIREAKSKPTVGELVEAYLELHAKVHKREKSIEEDKRNIDLYINPELGHMKVEDITSKNLQKLHRDLKDKPYVANRVRSLLSKMFNLAIQWRWISANPVLGVGKYQEEKRERWLDMDEMERLWVVLDRYANHPPSYIFKLLLLTGARKSEVLNATWDQIDLERGVWTKPAHLTKQKKNERLPLSSSALEVLRDLKSKHPSPSQFLFPGKVEGKPIQEVKTFWHTVLREAEIENCRIHDLRHTHASHLVSSGLSLSIVGKLLGHTQASTTQRYAHLADEPLREAAELFGSKVGKKTAQ